MDHSQHMAGHDMHDMPGHEMPAMCSMNVRAPFPALLYLQRNKEEKEAKLTRDDCHH